MTSGGLINSIIRTVIDHEIPLAVSKESIGNIPHTMIHYRPLIEFELIEEDDFCEQWTIFHDPKWKSSIDLMNEIEKKIKLALKGFRGKIECSTVPVYDDLHFIIVKIR